MGEMFPRITAIITEVEDGYTVTVYFRPAEGQQALLADEPIDTIQNAKALIADLANRATVGPDAVDIRIEAD